LLGRRGYRILHHYLLYLTKHVGPSLGAAMVDSSTEDSCTCFRVVICGDFERSGDFGRN